MSNNKEKGLADVTSGSQNTTNEVTEHGEFYHNVFVRKTRW